MEDCQLKTFSGEDHGRRPGEIPNVAKEPSCLPRVPWERSRRSSRTQPLTGTDQSGRLCTVGGGVLRGVSPRGGKASHVREALSEVMGWLWSVLSRPDGSPLVAVVLPTPTLAASPHRTDLFDPRGNRTGSAVAEGDRLDLFDLRGNRTSAGRIEGGRRVDVFDTRGNRAGYAVSEGDWVEFFQGRSNRTGSGRIRDGEVETFDWQGNRTGLGQWPAERGR